MSLWRRVWGRATEAWVALDRKWARDAERRFEAYQEKRRGTSGRVARLDAPGIARMLRPDGRPLVVHHLCIGALDGLEHLGGLGDDLGSTADIVTIAWQGGRPVDEVDAVVHAAMGGVSGRWRVLVHDGPDEELATTHGPPPPPARTLLLDADGAVLRTWLGAPDPKRMQAIVDIVKEASA